MLNCIILGSGRSGTSMVAGSLAKSGYYMGSNLYPPHPSNPKGFYESDEINGVNENILSLIIPRNYKIFGRYLVKGRLTYGQRWLARIPLSLELKSSKKITAKIRTLVSEEPFCFKDPRFSYTLPIWRPYLQNIGYICVFREPEKTISSIFRELNNRAYLRSLTISNDHVIDVWELMYSHIIEKHMKKGDWLFIHYNQMMDKDGASKLEDFLNTKIDLSFPNPNLETKSLSQISISKRIYELYRQLCELANYAG